MAPIVTGIDIARPPAEVFSYVSDPSRFGEWQSGIIRGGTEGEGPPAVGSRCFMIRRIAGAERTLTSEITELDPPRTWAMTGVDGPIRATVRVSVEPAAGGQHSDVTFSLDFSGRGIGKMLLPAITGQAAKEARQSCQNLKQRLEQAGPGVQPRTRKDSGS